MNTFWKGTVLEQEEKLENFVACETQVESGLQIALPDHIP